MQYKNHLSDFHIWEQKEHAEEWLLFPKNIGKKLSIDEVSVSNGELYTVLTNKAGKGGRGSLIAIIKGTKAEEITNVLTKISLNERLIVKEITLDFCPSMTISTKQAFPNAYLVADRFHVQKLISEALQEMRIQERWKSIKEENDNVKKAKKQKITYKPKIYSNGDTKKQLLARSRYLLFKPSSKWTQSQKERANILFTEFPELKDAYILSINFRSIYEYSQTKKQARKMLDKWYSKVKEKQFDSFITTAEYLKTRENIILNYFVNRSTNASAESFNAKLKGFRTLVRGVIDKKFFLFRVSKIFS